MQQFYLKNISEVDDAYEVGGNVRNRYPYQSQEQIQNFEIRKKMEELN